MIRTSLIAVAVVGLAGCGLAETAATGATTAAAETEQARQAQQTEKKVQDQVQGAVQQDAERRHAAEANDTN